MSEPIILIHRAQVYTNSIPVRYGVELDVRLYRGRPVLSHDPWEDDPDVGDFAPEAFLSKDQANFGVRPCYAWNLKEDGVEGPLAALLTDFPEIRAHSFVFDGSYPTMRSAHRLGLRCADRVSDEEAPARGVSRLGARFWLDCWNWDEPMTYAMNGVLEGDPDNARRVWLPGQHEVWAVSPELHVGHSPLAWLKYHWWLFFRLKVTGVCTDHPNECEQAYAQWAKETALSAGPA